jgi:hypothetical protein
MPTTQMLGWIEYLKEKERREQTRLVDAMSVAMSRARK